MEEVLSSNAIINGEDTVPVLYVDASSELNDKLRKLPSNIFVNFAKNVLVIDGEELRFDLVSQDQSSKRVDCYAEENQEYHFRGPILQKISMKRTLRPEDRANYKKMTRTEEQKKREKKTVALEDQFPNTGKKDMGKRRMAPTTRTGKAGPTRNFMSISLTTAMDTEVRASSSPEAAKPNPSSHHLSTPPSKKGQKRPLSPLPSSTFSSNGNNLSTQSTAQQESSASNFNQHSKASLPVTIPSSNGAREKDKPPVKYPRLSVPKVSAPSTSPTSAISTASGTGSTIGRSSSQGAQKPGDAKAFVIRLLISDDETTEGIEGHCQGKGWTKAELTRVLKQVATLRQNSKWVLKEEIAKEILTDSSFNSEEKAKVQQKYPDLINQIAKEKEKEKEKEKTNKEKSLHHRSSHNSKGQPSGHHNHRSTISTEDLYQEWKDKYPEYKKMYEMVESNVNDYQQLAQSLTNTDDPIQVAAIKKTIEDKFRESHEEVQRVREKYEELHERLADIRRRLLDYVNNYKKNASLNHVNG